MVERVAKAVYARNGWWRIVQPNDDGNGRYRKGFKTDRFRAVEWDELEVGEREQRLADARAAIEAMRNPTDEMIEACQRALVETMRDLGWSKEQKRARLSSQTKAVMRWNAMIDAALAEKGE